MTGAIGRALTILALLAASVSPAAAQRLIRAEASVGGLTTGIAPGGWPLWPYVDGAWAVLPMTSAVGELQFGDDVAALGGVRQDFFRSRKGNVYGQLLMGLATGYSSRCDLCQPKVIEFGVGGNIALDKRWALRIRADVRAGGGAGDIPVPTLGAGITRTWGSR